MTIQVEFGYILKASLDARYETFSSFKSCNPAEETELRVVLLPHSHSAPGMRGAGEAEDSPGLGEEAGRVSCVVPVTDHNAFLIPRHHQVVIHWRPVHGCYGALCVSKKIKLQ